MVHRKQARAFQKTVWDYYAQHGRHDLPWRRFEADQRLDPYKVVVSEMMLQQTQVARVIPKFNEFIGLFPSFSALSRASLGSVLKAWSGLGYNRRAKYLWQTARRVMQDYDEQLPIARQELVGLPGIGQNTAGAIVAYSFNQPVTFVETNIRTVFIHHFFKGEAGVDDILLIPLLQETLDASNPRAWYWALMDYGTYLKANEGNASKASKHYTRQSVFHGSRRQLRGQVLRLLTEQSLTTNQLETLLDDQRLTAVLIDLTSEELIVFTNNVFSLP